MQANLKRILVQIPHPAIDILISGNRSDLDRIDKWTLELGTWATFLCLNASLYSLFFFESVMELLNP